jgi:hypothetical protein
MYVKVNMYDALTYVMGRTCLRRHVHARERCVWLHSRMFYFVCFVSLPRTARQQFLRALKAPVSRGREFLKVEILQYLVV